MYWSSSFTNHPQLFGAIREKNLHQGEISGRGTCFQIAHTPKRWKSKIKEAWDNVARDNKSWIELWAQYWSDKELKAFTTISCLLPRISLKNHQHVSDRGCARSCKNGYLELLHCMSHESCRGEYFSISRDTCPCFTFFSRAVIFKSGCFVQKYWSGTVTRNIIENMTWIQ